MIPIVENIYLGNTNTSLRTMYDLFMSSLMYCSDMVNGARFIEQCSFFHKIALEIVQIIFKISQIIDNSIY